MDSIPEVLPDFEGKTVLLYYSSWESTEIIGVVSSPRFESQAGKLFLRGKTATTDDNWASGATMCVAWDDVSSYLVFGTEEYNRMQDSRSGWLGRKHTSYAEGGGSWFSNLLSGGSKTRQDP